MFPGKTCGLNDFVIKYGEIVQIEDRYCACVGDWFPNAFCASVHLPCKVQDLREPMCLAEPEIKRNK